VSADDSADLRDAQPSTFPFTGKLGALRSELLKHELPVAKTILDPLWSRDADRLEKEYMRQHPWELTREALINDLTETRTAISFDRSSLPIALAVTGIICRYIRRSALERFG
jgi:hypothetical protein